LGHGAPFCIFIEGNLTDTPIIGALIAAQISVFNFAMTLAPIECGHFLERGPLNLPSGGNSPPILTERLKQEGWTVDNLKYALKTGILPDGDTFEGSMGEVVRDGT
jgi:hypothetical protein